MADAGLLQMARRPREHNIFRPELKPYNMYYCYYENLTMGTSKEEYDALCYFMFDLLGGKDADVINNESELDTFRFLSHIQKLTSEELQLQVRSHQARVRKLRDLLDMIEREIWKASQRDGEEDSLKKLTMVRGLHLRGSVCMREIQREMEMEDVLCMRG